MYSYAKPGKAKQCKFHSCDVGFKTAFSNFPLPTDQSSKLKYVEWTCYDWKACKGVKSGSSTFSNTCNGKQKKSVFAEKNSDPPHRATFHVTSSKLKKKKKGIINPYEILVKFVTRTAADLSFNKFQFYQVFHLLISQGGIYKLSECGTIFKCCHVG